MIRVDGTKIYLKEMFRVSEVFISRYILGEGIDE